MFRIRLILKRVGENRMVYTVSGGFRLVFAGIAAILLGALTITPSEHPLLHASNTLPLILFGICLLACLYEERWVFDREGNLFERRVGLVFLSRKRSEALADLRCVQLNLYRMGVSRSSPEDGGLMKKRPLTRGLFYEQNAYYGSII